MHDYELCGFSLFETFCARRGTFWRLKDHWNRLYSSAEQFGMQAPDWDRFLKDVCARHDSSRNEILRYTLLQGGGRWTDGASRTEVRILKRNMQPPEERPLRLFIDERKLPVRDAMRCHKSGSRLLYQARYKEARARGFDDCVFIDGEGYLLESSTQNLLIRIDGTWVTPPLERGLLPGVVRGWLLGSKHVVERDVRLDDIDGCEAVLVANAVLGLRAVSAIGSRLLNTSEAVTLAQDVGERIYEVP